MIISKAQIKTISSYKIAKFRDNAGVFVVEGEKMVEQAIKSFFHVQTICATEQWLNQNHQCLKDNEIDNIFEIKDEDLKRISSLTSPNNVLAVLSRQKSQPIKLEGRLILVLDGINNPGNLGTIIREASWFGLTDVVCSLNTVDIYNPKSLQATMGAVFGVNITYMSLVDFLSSLPQGYNIYGTIVDSKHNIYQEKLSDEGLIVIGSESHGISKEVRELITKPLSIPNFSIEQQTESLNASIATAIVLSEFKRCE